MSLAFRYASLKPYGVLGTCFVRKCMFERCFRPVLIVSQVDVIHMQSFPEEQGLLKSFHVSDPDIQTLLDHRTGVGGGFSLKKLSLRCM